MSHERSVCGDPFARVPENWGAVDEKLPDWPRGCRAALRWWGKLGTNFTWVIQHGEGWEARRDFEVVELADDLIWNPYMDRRVLEWLEQLHAYEARSA